MNTRFIGGILLIVGTSIGGGMLALPIANAGTGFWQSSLFLLLCWAIMTLGALFILEANLYLPRGKHMISMAYATLGHFGLIVAWLSYLFLLYTLLSAYISGGADVLGSLFSVLELSLSQWQLSLLFTLLFGIVVYRGIYQVDKLNRFLMFSKLAIYFILIILIAPYIKLPHLYQGHVNHIAGSIMILITSFGFAIIVPNLRDYFEDDLKTLRQVILIGSLIPLLCYLAWDMVIMGSLPSDSPQGLASLMQNDHTTSLLADRLATTVHNSAIYFLFTVFTSVCMLTAFLGVSLCLMSFLADGMNIEQRGYSGLLVALLTFLPPLLIVIYYPGIYVHALNYAGIFCVILLLLLPSMMVLYGRRKFSSCYAVPGGNVTLYFIIICSVILLVNAIYQLLIS